VSASELKVVILPVLGYAHSKIDDAFKAFTAEFPVLFVLDLVSFREKFALEFKSILMMASVNES
jgi:hypothetical protein